MADRTVDRSSTSNILHVFIGNSSVTTGAGLTGLTNASSGLIISAIKPGAASPTVYSVASSNVETISTLGTYAAPSSGKIRFKEIDATNLPGWYEVHPADALFSVSVDTSIVFSFIGATNMRATTYVVQIGSPANMVRINGDATNGANATLSLKKLFVYNAAGHAIQATSDAAGYCGIYGQGSGDGPGIRGIGGNGTPGVPATAAPGIQGDGGTQAGDGSPQEWGSPGIRGIGGLGAPGLTAKGGLGGPGLYIFNSGAGQMQSPAVRIISSGTSAIEIDAGTLATVVMRLLGGSSGGADVFDAAAMSSMGKWFDPLLTSTNAVESVAAALSVGNVTGSVAGITWGPLTSSGATANTITFPDLVDFPSDYIIGNGLCNASTNFVAADIVDFETGTGICTIVSRATDGDWPATPDPGTVFFMQFLPTKEGIASRIWNKPLASHTTAGSAGKKLGDLPLSAAIVSAIWDEPTASHVTAGSMGKALGDASAGGDLSAITDQLDDIEAMLVGDTLNVTVVSPLSQNGRKLEIVQGDDYANDDGRAIDFTSASWPTLTAATVSFQAKATPGTATLTKAMSVVTATGTKKVRLELADTDTVSLTPGSFAYDIVATLSNGNKVTLVRGAMTLLDDLD